MDTRKYSLPILVAAIAVATGCGGGGGGTSKKPAAGTGISGGGVSGASGTVVPVGNLATGRVAHSATYLKVRVNNVDQETVVVIGGKGRAGTTDTVLDSAEIYDIATGQFTPAQGRLSGAQQTGANGRMNHTAIALPAGKILVAGGHTDVAGANALNSAEIYNGLSAMAQFSRAGGTLTHAKAEPMVFLYNPPNGTGTPEVMIGGGRQRSGSTDVALSSVDFYKPDSNSIVNKSPLNNQTTVTLRQARWGAEAAALSSATDAEWIVSGGVSGSTVAGFEVFDPTARAFNQTSKASPSSTNASLLRNRTLHQTALLGSQIAVIGGRDGALGGAAVDTIELYDPATNVWTAITEPLEEPRFAHTATRVNSGDIVVIGGQSSTTPALASIEVISGSGIGAKTEKLSQTLRAARRNHTATYFQNAAGVEMILIIGGEDASGTPIASAEVFVLGTSSQVPVLPPIGGNGQQPAILTLTPAQGPVGTQVTVTGNNFSLTASQNIVKFNGVVAPVQSAASSTTTQGAVDLRVAVPQGATTGDVTVSVGGMTSAGKLFTISTSTGTSTGTGGTQFSGPPRIFILLPTAGPSFMPLGIGGSNFDVGTIPYVNGMPSISLFNFSTRQLPLIGSISVGFTIVPPGAPSGPGDVVVEYIQQRSNPFPFSKN